jgi:hypothetical protein
MRNQSINHYKGEIEHKLSRVLASDNSFNTNYPLRFTITSLIISTKIAHEISPHKCVTSVG